MLDTEVSTNTDTPKEEMQSIDDTAKYEVEYVDPTEKTQDTTPGLSGPLLDGSVSVRPDPSLFLLMGA